MMCWASLASPYVQNHMASLYETFPAAEARRIVKRWSFTTPQHRARSVVSRQEV